MRLTKTGYWLHCGYEIEMRL